MAISTVSAGTIVSPTWGNSVAAAINAHEDAWTSFTPTGTGFTVGAGSILSRYNEIGKTIIYRGQVTFGAGAGVTGDFSVNLPVSAFTTVPGVGSLDMLDSGTSHYVGSCLITGSSTLEFHGTFGPTNAGRVNGTNPFTFVPGDVIRWAITYQAA